MFLSNPKVLEFCPKFCITFPLPVTSAGFPGEREGCGAGLPGQHPPGWLRPPAAAPAGARPGARAAAKAKPSRTSIQSLPKRLGHMPRPNLKISLGRYCALPAPNRAAESGGGPGPQAVYSTAHLGATASSQRWLLKANKLALVVLGVPLRAVTGNVTSCYSVCTIGLGVPPEESRALGLGSSQTLSTCLASARLCRVSLNM